MKELMLENLDGAPVSDEERQMIVDYLESLKSPADFDMNVFMDGMSKLENASQVETVVVSLFKQALEDGLRAQEVPEVAIEPATRYIMMGLQKDSMDHHDKYDKGMPEMGDIDMTAIESVMNNVDPEEIEAMASAHLTESAVAVIGGMIGQVPEEVVDLLVGRLDEMLSNLERLDDFDLEAAWEVLEPAISPE